MAGLDPAARQRGRPARRGYPKLIYYNKLAKGGHFTAWEQPKLFTEELRAGFRSLRK
jgi:pimeloyl-ACP methyl ester carboxylesterase